MTAADPTSAATRASTTPPIVLALRQATRAHHDRVERGLPLVGGTPPLTRAEYRRVLEAFLGFHAPIEERLGALDWASIGFDFAPRRRAHLLREDLAALGVGDQVPICEAIPEVRRPVEGLGCLYVLEGSTLGGQVIRRHLAAQLDISPSTGGAFFNGHGAATGAFWRAFVDHLATVDSADERLVVDAACATFAALERWFSARGVLR